MVAQRNSLLAKQLAQSHNDGLSILAPRADVAGYKKISRLSELPFQLINVGELAAKHAGERYVIVGHISTVPFSDGEGEEKLSLSLNTDADEGSVILSSDALNGYQKHFLVEHCWLGDRPSSMCEGDVFISVRGPPGETLLEELELDGAFFKRANEASVLSQLSDE
jgi:hypothetical protein